jgi:sulfoxide reductase heme-binding subunit YedZ
VHPTLPALGAVAGADRDMARAPWYNLVHLAAVPLTTLGLALLVHTDTGWIPTSQIGAVAKYMGEGPATYILLGSLGCTPARQVLGWKWAAAWRKPLGLYAFGYGACALVAFAADRHFNPVVTAGGIANRPFVMFGVAALLIMVVLAATSLRRAVRWLGGRRWRLLHRLAYVAAFLVLIHLALVPHEGQIHAPKPAALFTLLMLLRVPAIRRRAAAVAQPVQQRLLTSAADALQRGANAFGGTT